MVTFNPERDYRLNSVMAIVYSMLNGGIVGLLIEHATNSPFIATGAGLGTTAATAGIIKAADAYRR